MTKLSELISKEIQAFKDDLKETYNQEFDRKNPEHRRRARNIVANMKGYFLWLKARGE
ncbi:MAG TPA: hypothetical protein VIQ31_05125 [Phormidium sp.]